MTVPHLTEARVTAFGALLIALGPVSMALYTPAMPSLVAEIGDVIESHMRSIGLLKEDGPDAHQRKMIEEQRTKYELGMKAIEEAGENTFPPEATLCGKCQTKAVIVMDGCLTCLNCGDSKCS